jgi:hypothetical protein
MHIVVDNAEELFGDLVCCALEDPDLMTIDVDRATRIFAGAG